MRSTDEKLRIGREIKTFLAVNGIARETFAERAGLGKSTVDKLITGIFSDETLAKVLEKTRFRLRTLYAAEKLGSYSKANWDAYISDYLMVFSALDGSGAVEACAATIDWDDTLPGLFLSQGGNDSRERDIVGSLWIPHERSPLIYIQPPEDIGVRLVVTTMIGAPVMRGLLLAVENSMSNAWIPVATPVVLKRQDSTDEIHEDQLGRIEPPHPSYASYAAELTIVLQRQFGRLVTGDFVG